MTDAEREKRNQQIDAQISNLLAETAKLTAETRKLSKEADWYLLAIGSAATLAIVAVVKLFLT